MGKTLNLTKAGEYAIAALSRLALEAERPEPRTVTAAALAVEQRIPASFLAKILASLAKSGLIRSYCGAKGGVALGRPAGKITLLAIIEACEGGYSRETCVFYPDRACEGPRCPVYCPLRGAEEGITARLREITLEQMAGSLRRHTG